MYRYRVYVNECNVNVINSPAVNENHISVIVVGIFCCFFKHLHCLLCCFCCIFLSSSLAFMYLPSWIVSPGCIFCIFGDKEPSLPVGYLNEVTPNIQTLVDGNSDFLFELRKNYFNLCCISIKTQLLLTDKKPVLPLLCDQHLQRNKMCKSHFGSCVG